jgi:hypothetical protein
MVYQNVMSNFDLNNFEIIIYERLILKINLYMLVYIYIYFSCKHRKYDIYIINLII